MRKTPSGRRKASLKDETEFLDLPDHELQSQIQQKLLVWYRQSHRDLPWRKTQDPYAIWISEIMLQQTRVDTVKDYYLRFLARFETAIELAQAPLQEVLAMWSGLGYYSRARNLHKAAREIAETYAGRFPSEPEAIQALPGIGPYTAGAILSIAFGQPAPLVDGNVIRVLSRLFAIEDPLESSQTQKKYWRLAQALVPSPAATQVPAAQNDPGDFNQALMELGATVCLPQNPTCLVCPLKQTCQARLLFDPNQFPPKKRARTIPTIENVVLVLMNQNKVLLARRPELGLWGGLFEFPMFELETGQEAQQGWIRCGKEKLGLDLQPMLDQITPLPPFEQILTHRHMKFTPYLLRLKGRRPTLRPKHFYTEFCWVDPTSPKALGMAVWVNKLLAVLRQKI